MATFLRPLGIVLRNRLVMYNVKSWSCKDKLIRTQQFLCPDLLKNELHSLCIQSRLMSTPGRRLRHQLELPRAVIPIGAAKGHQLQTFGIESVPWNEFSVQFRMAQHGVDAKKLKASTEKDEFDALFPEIVEDLTKNEIRNPEIADPLIRFREVLLYNVPYGRKMRGVSVVTTYKHLVSGASEADLKIARVLGWCIELLNACILVVDDIMDNSLNRRGKTCWYKKDNVGFTAINDAFFLECCIYSLLRKYIRDKPYYLTIIELFTQSTLQIVIGQCLDTSAAPPEAKCDFSQFTMERYSAIVKWKTAFYTCYLPVAIAMHMAGISDEESHTEAKTILLQMGHFFQVQNDYRDCYGTREVSGKVGSDIEENKCSWLILKALEIASDEQKEELKLNYGRRDTEAVEKVIAIYRDLKLEDVYKQYEGRSYQEIINLINSADTTVPKEVFLDFANKIYKEISYFLNVDR